MPDRWAPDLVRDEKAGRQHHSKKRPANWEDRLNRKKNRLHKRGKKELIEDLRLIELEEIAE